MTKRPDQHNIDHEEAGTTDHKFRRDPDDPDPDRETDEPAEATPDRPPTPQELLEQQKKQARSDRADELSRARENVESGDEDG